MGWTPLRDYDARRILIIKPSSLGDIIHSLPVLTALRHRYPQAHIAWVINQGYEPLLQGHPDLDGTLAFDRNAFRRGLVRAVVAYRKFVCRFREECFDHVVDFQGLFRSGLMGLATGARVGESVRLLRRRVG